MSLTVPEFAGLQTSKASLHYFNVAGIAILVFDYFITIEDEARWVWGRRWDTTRLIFTVSRYLPFLGTGLTSYYLSINSASTPCPASLQITENVVHIIGVIAAELLLILRTYAFWHGNKRLLYGLLAYVTVSISAAVVIDTIPTQFLTSGQPQLGCLLESPGNSAIVYSMLLIYEIVIFVLIAYKSFGASRGTRSSLVRTIYRDGMFYVLCIIAITLVNVIISFALPASYVFKSRIPKADSVPS
ncbi:hypothetical protein BU15DRAFT_76127 [Melanogaster broomeanus]|nr:hypothetical protein BU15DRAFT_76127 [Melanogaster broomeanus]